MTTNITALTNAQVCYEQRFNCLVCWNPRLKMVYGSCQHRLCVDCLYDSNGIRRKGLTRCPSCQKIEAFPFHRPDIPEDNIEMQKRLGVVECPNEQCDAEVWEWELENHLEECSWDERYNTKPKSSRSRKGSTRATTSQNKPKSRKQKVTKRRSSRIQEQELTLSSRRRRV